MKEPTISKLKKKVWTEFSIHVRSKGADWGGFVSCITCNAVKHWKQMQAGHFIPGRHNAILFDERGCHPQCYHCNIGLKGNPRKYDAFMRMKYGENVIRELEKLDATQKKFTLQELEILLKKYKNANKQK